MELSTPNRLRILIADDSSLMRDAIKELLDSNPNDWRLCGEAADGIEALEQAQKLAPDVVLLDLSLPPNSGLEVAASLINNLPTTTIVLISQQDPIVLSRLAASKQIPYSIPKSDLATELPTVLQKIQQTKTTNSR